MTFEGPYLSPLVATADGRYLVWIDSEGDTGYHLALYDRIARSAAVVSRHHGTPPTPFNARIVAHEREVSVLAMQPGQPLLHASAAGVRTVIPGGRTLQFHGTTADGRIALLADSTGARRVHVETGQFLNEVSGREFTSYWAISGDGADLFGHSVRYDPVRGQMFSVVTRYDASTGAIVAEREFTLDRLGYGLTTEPRSGRLYLDLMQGRYLVLDASTLAELGTVATAIQQLPLVPVFARLAFDPHHPRAFLLATGPGQPGVRPSITRTMANRSGMKIDVRRYAIIVSLSLLSTMLLLTACGSKRQVTGVRRAPPAPKDEKIAYAKVEKRESKGVQYGVASWYGPDFHGKPTSSGEIYDMYQLTCAHNTLPLGTMVIVTNLENGKSLELRVNDRGPFAKDRISTSLMPRPVSSESMRREQLGLRLRRSDLGLMKPSG